MLRGIAIGVCGWGSSSPNMLGFRWRFILGLSLTEWEESDGTVVGAVLELLDVAVLEHLLDDDPVLLFSDDTDDVDTVLDSLALVAVRVLVGVGGGGVAVGDGFGFFVRNFFACFVLIFSSSSEDGELMSLLGTARAAALNVGTRFKGWRGFGAPSFGGDTPNASIRWWRCMREISARSDREGRYWSEELERVDMDLRSRRELAEEDELRVEQLGERETRGDEKGSWRDSERGERRNEGRE